MRLAVMAMVGGFLATAAHAAPVPPQVKVPAKAVPAPGAVAPRFLVLRPTEDGKIMVNVFRTERRAVMIAVAPAAGGAAVPPPVQAGVSVAVQAEIELADVKDLTVFNTAGKEVSKEETLKALAKGGVVVVSADGKPVDPAFTGMFKEGTLVLVSPVLVTPPAGAGMATAVPAMALPVNVPAALPAGAPQRAAPGGDN